ncbi:MAG: hypothetical protein ACO3MB_12490 [Saprospiraceae bacterium]
MKIFVTTFVYNEREYSGPNIYAESFEIAKAIAELEGYKIEGELTDIIASEEDIENRTIH